MKIMATVLLFIPILIALSFAVSHALLWSVGTIAGVELVWTPARWLATAIVSMYLYAPSQGTR